MHSIPPPSGDAVPAGVAPRRCYLICSTARSGANLLCEDLRNTGVAGNPHEYFLPWFRPGETTAASSAEFLRNLLAEGTMSNGVFGAKIMWEHLEGVVDRLRIVAGDASSPVPRLLAAVFPGLRYLRTVRRDKIRQAVSMAKAVQSGQWTLHEPAVHSLTPEQILEWTRFTRGFDASIEQIVEYLRTNPAPPRAAPSPGTVPLRYDFEQIAGCYRDIVKDEASWGWYFAMAGITPHTVEYEDLAANYHGTICAALDYLEVPRPSGPPLPSFRFHGMQRQSDAVNEEWVARFTADFAASLK